MLPQALITASCRLAAPALVPVAPPILLLALVLFQAPAVLAQDGADNAEDSPVMAELQPLAPESLLLDILRTSEGRLVAVGERGHVVTSSDGREWSQAESVPTRATLTAVAAAGNELWAAGHDTVILHSADGGANWELRFHDPDRQQPIMDLKFRDADTGWAIGAYGLMLTTRDGGVTWEEGLVSVDEWHLNGLVDLGGDRLVITGEKGYSYFSTDGGENWTIVEMPYPGSMFGALQAGDCVVVFGLRGHVQESCDGGENWTELDVPADASLAGGAWRDGELLLVGNSGQLLLRGEDGAFRAELHPSGVDFAAAVPLDGGGWLLVGEDGSHIWPPAGVPVDASQGEG